jgi:hypothetical protein
MIKVVLCCGGLIAHSGRDQLKKVQFFACNGEQRSCPHTLQKEAGDPVQIPAGVVHDACATNNGVKVLTVHVIEKGKPLGSPAP